MNEESVLFQRLSAYTNPLSFDFRQKVLAACETEGIPQFADPIVHNLEGMRDVGIREGYGELNAGHIVAVVLSAIFMMIEQRYSAENVIAAIKVGPKLLVSPIPNPTVQKDALTYYFEKIDEIAKNK